MKERGEEWRDEGERREEGKKEEEEEGGVKNPSCNTDLGKVCGREFHQMLSANMSVCVCVCVCECVRTVNGQLDQSCKFSSLI